MTLKTHVILHHYGFYFSITGKTLKDTNGEYVEALHNTLRIHEDVHGYKVVRKIGTPGHVQKSQKSLSHLNVRMAGARAGRASWSGRVGPATGNL